MPHCHSGASQCDQFLHSNTEMCVHVLHVWCMAFADTTTVSMWNNSFRIDILITNLYIVSCYEYFNLFRLFLLTVRSKRQPIPTNGYYLVWVYSLAHYTGQCLFVRFENEIKFSEWKTSYIDCRNCERFSRC